VTFTSGNRIGKNEKNEDENRRCCGMRMKKILSIVLVMVLLASAVSLAITPAAAIYPYEKKIPGDADENDELTKGELVNAILPYMLGEGAYALDDVGDAAHVYAYWDGKPKMVREVSYDRTVKFYRPVERVVSVSPDATKTIIALGECDKIVAGRTNWCICRHYESRSGEGASKCAAEVCGGRLIEIPQVSSSYGSDINVEKIVCEKPDVFIGYGGDLASVNAFQKKTGIPLVRGRFHGGKNTFFENLYSHFECIGTLLDKEEEAEELKSFIEEKLDKLEEVISQIPDDEKPKVYIVSRSRDFATTLPNFEPLDIAGGINVADDAGEKKGDLSLKVLKEQVIKWNPDIILINRGSLTRTAAVTIESVLLDPDLQTVNAVKNESVYYSMSPHCYGKPADRVLTNTLYLAKLFYPDKFKDLDLEEEGNEIYEAFLGVDGLFSENADYLVWMREYLDSQK
jgi:iron complex transport system substrate-binding protein